VSASDPETVPKGAKEVLSYFLRNPHAVDSLEGVARWRLLEETIHHRVEEVDGAVSWLVSQGFLMKEPTVRGFHTYRLNRDRADEAARLLAKATGSRASEPRLKGRRKSGSALQTSATNRRKGRLK
jgi:hypothetical protein